LANGITYPSKEAKLTFNGTGVIQQVLVKEGDRVKAGDPLLAEDDRAERAKLESDRIAANSTLQIDGEEKTLAQKKVELARKQQIFDGGGANASEVEEAKLDVAISDIKVRLRREEWEQNKLKASQQEILVEKMKLTSPIDGIVEEIKIHLGEVVDPSKPYVSVVQNDPLWVEVPLPSAQAAKLKTGDVFPVAYEGDQSSQPAKVIFLSPVVEAQSDMRSVRLEMPNPHGRPAGLHVTVKLPDGIATAAVPSNP
jgi:RND family efflux transporter MFP subunit